jgi:8-oxo-(d)GTP phosphatase
VLHAPFFKPVNDLAQTSALLLVSGTCLGLFGTYMRLFLNDKFIHIRSTPADPSLLPPPAEFTLFPDVPLSNVKLAGHIIIHNGTPAYIDAILNLLVIKRMRKLDRITFYTNVYEDVKAFVKSQFKIVKAAGGLVSKPDPLTGEPLYLLIHRLGVWDLPKGKLEKGERTLEGGLREVQEECAITISPGEKICSTWHAYFQDGRRILKKTTWFHMALISDEAMRPQIEESIDDLQWFTVTEANEKLDTSYRSIKEVFAEATLQHTI